VAETGGDTVKFSEGGPSNGVSMSIAKRKADSHTADGTFTKDGKVLRMEHDVISADGKTFRSVLKGTDDQGKPLETVRVFDRQ